MTIFAMVLEAISSFFIATFWSRPVVKRGGFFYVVCEFGRF